MPTPHAPTLIVCTASCASRRSFGWRMWVTCRTWSVRPSSMLHWRGSWNEPDRGHLVGRQFLAQPGVRFSLIDRRRKSSSRYPDRRLQLVRNAKDSQFFREEYVYSTPHMSQDFAEN